MKIKFDFKKHSVLFISDAHMPYHHPDTFKFLAALKKKHRFKLVVSVGDLADFHNISFHKSDPDLLSAGDELEALRKCSKRLEKMFPRMVIVGSNHGDLPIRKMFDAGLPTALLRPYNEIYGVGKGWKFVDDLTMKSGDDVVYVCHGISKNGLKLAAQRGVNVVQGHYHTDFRIDYISNPRSLLWSMQVGCLIDRQSLAFAYDKLNLSRPIIGVGLLNNGIPQLVPMLLNEDGRWIGKL